MTRTGRAAQELAHALACLGREIARTDGKDATRYWQRRVMLARLKFRDACAAENKPVYEVGYTPELPWSIEDDNETLT